MIVALLAAVVPVLMGLVLAATPFFHGRVVGPARTFAVGAALAVVITTLLPGAAAHLGAWVLLLFAAGLMLPAAIERLTSRRVSSGHSTAGEELVLVGMAAHQFVDGLQIGAAWRLDLEPAAVSLAVAAHSVPLVAALLLEFSRHSGHRQAVLRGLLLAVATGAGAATGFLGSDAVPGAEGWLPALLSGLLLHVLWHHLDELPPLRTRDRWSELLALVAGAALPLALMNIGHSPHSHGGHSPQEFGHMLEVLARITAGPALLGLAAGAVAQVVTQRWRPRSGGGAATQRLLLGLPVPLCSCKLLPAAEGLLRRRTAAALVIAFVFSAPQLGLETLTLSYRFLGPELTALRALGGLGAALAAAAVAAHGLPTTETRRERHDATSSPSLGRALLDAFDSRLAHVGPFLVMGLVFSALLAAFLQPGEVQALTDRGLDIAFVSILGVPLYICPTAVTPFVAVLWQQGLSGGAALAAVLLGPATNLAVLGFLVATWGRRAALRGLGTFTVITLALALLTNRLLPELAAPSLPMAHHGHEHGAHPLHLDPIFLTFGAVLLRSVWRAGPRGWLAEMRLSGNTHDHDHSHHHGHRHP